MQKLLHEIVWEESWFYQVPAMKFWEGLPLGTGRLASMFYGTPDMPSLSLCDETLWSGGPYQPAPERKDMVNKIHEAICQNNYLKAQELALSLRGTPAMVQQYRSLGRMRMHTEHTMQRVKNYLRSLNFFDGLAHISYEVDGARYEQQAFASFPDQLVALRMRAQDAPIDIDGFWETEQPVHMVKVVPQSNGGAFVLEGGVNDAEFSGARTYEVVLPSVLSWRLQGFVEVKNASGLQANVQLSVKEGTLFWRISGASEVTLYLTCATDYVDYQTVGGDKKTPCEKAMQAAKLGFDVLRRRQSEDLRQQMERFTLRLDGPEGKKETERLLQTDTTSRMARLKEGKDDPMFCAQYAQYGRYILLCGARPGTLAFNNHNIWAEQATDRWRGRWTLNINLQECYWLASITGLGETVETLLTFTEQLAQSGARSAKLLYGARGWCAHHGADAWMHTAAQDVATWHSTYPLAGAWLCWQLYDHYLFEGKTMQEKLRPRLLKLLSGAVAFALDLLVTHEGYRMPCPSSSPENFFISPQDGETRIGVTIGSTHDVALVHALFRAYLDLSQGETDEEILALAEEARQALPALPPMRIAADGTLCEWFYDYTPAPEELRHRHISHLFAVYPDDKIHWEETPELARAVERSLEERGHDNLGWAGAWRACIYARLGKSDLAYTYLKTGMPAVSLHPSKLDSSVTPSFEGNQAIQGWGAALCEMLAQCCGKERKVHLLPALPAQWPSGKVRGFCLRGGKVLDFDWENGKITYYKERSNEEND